MFAARYEEQGGSENRDVRGGHDEQGKPPSKQYGSTIVGADGQTGVV
ncbi:MAG: hypothetical protein ACHRXM_12975 [Isosphaerales bacterium]